MGDRGNIIIQGGDVFPHPLYCYTHWTGSDLPKLLSSALAKGRECWDDPAYLARVVFQTMLGGDEGIKSYGLSTSEGDGGTDLYLDPDKQQVRLRGETLGYADFIAKHGQ